MRHGRLPFSLVAASLLLSVSAGTAIAGRVVALSPRMKPVPSDELRDRFHEAVVRGLLHGGEVLPVAELKLRLGIDPQLYQCDGGSCVGRVGALLRADRVVFTGIEAIGKDYTISVKVFDGAGQPVGNTVEEHCDVCTVREVGEAVEKAAQRALPLLAEKRRVAPVDKPPVADKPTAVASTEEDEPGGLKSSPRERRATEPSPTREPAPHAVAPAAPTRAAPTPAHDASPPADAVASHDASAPREPGGSSETAHTEQAGGPFKALGGVFLGAAVASLVGTAVFGYYAARENGDSKYTCDASNPRTDCPKIYQGNTAPAIALGVTTAVAATTGIIMLALDRRRHSPSTPSVSAGILPGGFAVSASVHF